MAYDPTNPILNGGGKRKCQSWIESFVEYTKDLESPLIFRRWVAISVIAATLEQKVWLKTGSRIAYPNLYVFLVGPPGVGKTAAIMAAQGFYRELPKPKLSPTSVSKASLVDCLDEFKVFEPQFTQQSPLQYNSMYIMADELSSFMSEYSPELVGILTTLYDVNAPYKEAKRVGALKKLIERPQLNVLCGTTPENLVKTFNKGEAWGQGFASRTIMIFSTDRGAPVDKFEAPILEMPDEMIYDLRIIDRMIGGFSWDEEYHEKYWGWKNLGYTPVPTHPKLEHYCTRREQHHERLAMISSVDRGNDLKLTKLDFDRAYNWLCEAEKYMPRVFGTGSTTVDGRALQDLLHFIKDEGGSIGIHERKINNWTALNMMRSQRMDAISALESAGLIEAIRIDKMNLRTFRAVV